MNYSPNKSLQLTAKALARFGRQLSLRVGLRAVEQLYGNDPRLLRHGVLQVADGKVFTLRTAHRLIDCTRIEDYRLR